MHGDCKHRDGLWTQARCDIPTHPVQREHTAKAHRVRPIAAPKDNSVHHRDQHIVVPQKVASLPNRVPDVLLTAAASFQKIATIK